MALTDGLIAKYDFDSGLTDDVGSYDLVAYSGANVSGGKLAFPNLNSGAYPSSRIPTGNQFTISLWFEDLKDRSQALSGWMMFDGTGVGSSAGHSGVANHYLAAIFTNDELGAYYSPGSGGTWAGSGYSMTNISHSGRHHLVITYDNGDLTYYIDGQQAGNTVQYPNNAGEIQVFGSWSSYNYAPAESLDEIRVYNRVISSAELSELYTGIAPTPPGTKYDIDYNPEIISSSVPTGAMGIEKTSGDNGFFVYSQKPYTLWLKDSLGTWSVHQTFTSENLVNGSSFKWGVDQAAYFQTSESPHDIHIYTRKGALLIDSTPTDGNNVIDALVLDDASTLKILGSSATVTTESVHAISSGSPVTIADGCDASVVVKEVVSDYTDSLSSKLAGYYKFNGNANNELGGSPGTVTGATYVADKDNVGQAISFDGSGDYAILSDDLMDLGNDFTISAWVYADSSDTAAIWAFTNQVYDGTTKMLGIRFGATRAAGAKWNRANAVAINLPSGNQWSTYSKIAGANSLPQDQWAHITVTVEDYETTAPIVKLFVNGVSQPVYDGGSQPSIVSALEWGDTANSAFVGKLDPPGGPNHLTYSEHSHGETIVWKRALSESEVSELYGTPAGQELNLAYATTETVRNDFTVEKTVTVTAPAGTDTTNIKVEITK